MQKQRHAWARKIPTFLLHEDHIVILILFHGINEVANKCNNYQGWTDFVQYLEVSMLLSFLVLLNM